MCAYARSSDAKFAKILFHTGVDFLVRELQVTEVLYEGCS